MKNQPVPFWQWNRKARPMNLVPPGLGRGRNHAKAGRFSTRTLRQLAGQAWK